MDPQSITAQLFSPATLTKKAPKPVSYDPIAHTEKRFIYQDGRVVAEYPRSPDSYRPHDNSTSMRRNVSNPQLSSRRAAPILSRNWYFGVQASPSYGHSKTRVRDEVFDPILGTRKKFEVSSGYLQSLGTSERVVPHGEVSAIARPGEAVRDSVAGSRKAQVQSVAYVSPYLI